MKPRSQPMRRTPLRRTGIKRPVIRLPKPRAREAAKLYDELRRAVQAREGGRCAACRHPVRLHEGECHHRKMRSRGGPDTGWCCVWLCQGCHADIHAYPAHATRQGWLVPSWADEHAWPVWRDDLHGWYQPTPDGWTTAEPTEQQQEAS